MAEKKNDRARVTKILRINAHILTYKNTLSHSHEKLRNDER